MSDPKILNERRKRLRLSMPSLAASTSLHPDTVWRVLNGKTDPRRSTLAKMEAALAIEEQRLAASLTGGVL